MLTSGWPAAAVKDTIAPQNLFTQATSAPVGAFGLAGAPDAPLVEWELQPDSARAAVTAVMTAVETTPRRITGSPCRWGRCRRPGRTPRSVALRTARFDHHGRTLARADRG